MVDHEKKRITGSIEVESEETTWKFTPEVGWRAGRYSLLCDAQLEDLAGNSIKKPFEVDIFSQVDRTLEVETVDLPFTIEAPRGK